MHQPTPVRQTNALAVVSLICGILGWTMVPFLGSIAAIITGHIARSQIARARDYQEGDGLALSGLIMGWLAVAVWIVGIAVMLLFFGGLAWFAHSQGQY